MVSLMRKMHKVMDLIEYENEDLWHIFDEVIATELFNFTSNEWICEMAKLAYEMELPYKAFWAAMVNIALLKHQELAFVNLDSFSSSNNESLIDLVYYITKSKRSSAA